VRGRRTKLPNDNILTLPFTEYCWVDRDTEGERVGGCRVRMGGREGHVVNTSKFVSVT